MSMHRFRKSVGRGALLLGLAAAALAVPAAGLRGALVPLDLDTLTARSTVIVCGEVVAARSFWRDFPKHGPVIVTDIEIRIAEVWRGKDLGETVTVQMFGGQVGDEIVACLESPRYAIGEKVLVFARPWHDVLWNTGWLQGKYALAETASGPAVRGDKHLPIREARLLESVRAEVKAKVAALAPAAGTGARPAGGGGEASAPASGSTTDGSTTGAGSSSAPASTPSSSSGASSASGGRR